MAPFHGLRNVMPVLSSGQWADQAHDTYEATKTTDLMYLCGGGIMAHPMGIAAGVASIQQAWQGGSGKSGPSGFCATTCRISCCP